MLHYTVITKQDDTVTIKGFYSTFAKASNAMKTLAKSVISYDKDNLARYSKVTDKYANIQSEDCPAGTYDYMQIAVHELEYELDYECEIELF